MLEIIIRTRSERGVRPLTVAVLHASPAFGVDTTFASRTTPAGCRTRGDPGRDQTSPSTRVKWPKWSASGLARWSAIGFTGSPPPAGRHLEGDCSTAVAEVDHHAARAALPTPSYLHALNAANLTANRAMRHGDLAAGEARRLTEVHGYRISGASTSVTPCLPLRPATNTLEDQRITSPGPAGVQMAPG